MSRPLHVIAVAAALVLTLGGCGEQKDTGFNNLPKPAGGTAAGGGTEIKMLAGNKFEPATFKAKTGQAVTWVYEDTSGQPHNAIADDGSFDSSPGCTATEVAKCMGSAGQKFTFTFSKAGKFAYYCVIHGAKGGIGMSGVVEVA